MTPQNFDKYKAGATDENICRTWAQASLSKEPVFLGRVYREVVRRGLDDDRCVAIVKKEEADLAAGLGAVLGLALVVAAAKHGGAPPATEDSSKDTQWAWDQFFDDDYNLVWSCRGVQTGKFSEAWRCAGLAQIDSRWPGWRLRK